jgi:uncharacterized protein with LGFP repeats
MPRSARKTSTKIVALAAVGASFVVPAVTTALQSATRPAAASQGKGPVRPLVSDLRLGDATKSGPARLAARETAGFGLVGITWQPRSGTGVLAQVRTRSAGRWSDWRTLPVDGRHGPDRGQSAGRDGTDPVWVGTADGVQARVASTDGAPVRDVRLSLVDAGTSASDATFGATTGTTTAPAPYARPGIVNRAAWGADESLRSYNADCDVPKYGSTIKAAFVHHTAGSNTYTSDQSAAIVRGIYAFHVKSRGWCDIGYNFLVDRFGRIFEGRYGGITLPVVGAHTENYNTDSFGVSLMGDFTTTEPSAAIMESAAKLLAWKLDGNYRNPNGTVVMNGTTLSVISGHRDTKATECPGSKVYAKLPALRSRVWTLMGGSVATEIYGYAVQLGGYAKVGQPYYLEHPVAEGRGTWFGLRDIYYSTGTGPHSVYGPIRTLHRALGNANGVLGLPRTEEQDARVAGARVQEFRKAGVRRAVYWSQATGAHEVLDAIFAKYVELNGELSRLGLPKTGQLGTPVAGGRVNVFENGRIYSGPTTGAHALIGVFNTKYIEAGVYTQLGLPTTDEYAVTGGLRQDFQGGTITWDEATGQTTVTYN